MFIANEELLTNLEDQAITDTRRITTHRKRKVLTTKNIILTLNSPNLPTRTNAGYKTYSTRPSIPALSIVLNASVMVKQALSYDAVSPVHIVQKSYMMVTHLIFRLLRKL